MVCVVPDRAGVIFRESDDRRARCVHDIHGRRKPLHGLEHVEGADHVDARAEGRVLPAGRHLQTGEVDHPGRLRLLDDPCHGLSVRDISVRALDPSAQVGLENLPDDVIVLLQIEEGDPAPFQRETPCDPCSDEALPAGEPALGEKIELAAGADGGWHIGRRSSNPPSLA